MVHNILWLIANSKLSLNLRSASGPLLATSTNGEGSSITNATQSDCDVSIRNSPQPALFNKQQQAAAAAAAVFV